jgi:ATP-binding cassette subfamily F protein uup
VSHDRYFVDQVATLIHAFDSRQDGNAGSAARVVPFASLAQWEAWRAETAEQTKAAGKSRAGGDAAVAGGAGGKKRLGYIEQREYEAIEATIAAAEAALATTVADSQRPENASEGTKLVALLDLAAQRQAEVDRLYARWAELDAKLNPAGG